VVLLGDPERLEGDDLGDDGALQRPLVPLARGLGQPTLLVGVREDHRAVLGTDVGSLPVQGRRVVDRPEDLEQRVVADHTWVEAQVADLGMPGPTGADLLVGRGRDAPAGEAHLRAHHPRNRRERFLDAPEAARAEGCPLRHLLLGRRRLESERERVGAVAKPRRSRSILEDVAEVRATARAADLRPDHAVAPIDLGGDPVRVQRLEEARPAAAGLELRCRGEQRGTTRSAVVGPILVPETNVPVPSKPTSNNLLNNDELVNEINVLKKQLEQMKEEVLNFKVTFQDDLNKVKETYKTETPKIVNSNKQSTTLDKEMMVIDEILNSIHMEGSVIKTTHSVDIHQKDRVKELLIRLHSKIKHKRVSEIVFKLMEIIDSLFSAYIGFSNIVLNTTNVNPNDKNYESGV
jgi:hypothetical protein